MNYTNQPAERVDVGWLEWIELCPGVLQVECSHLRSSNCTVLEVQMADGASIPRHNHPTNKETIFVIEGQIIDKETNTTTNPNGAYVIPAGIYHEIHAVGHTLLNVIFHPKLTQ
jgi:quercetin dioxygenase-like cupin family protein